MEFAELQPDLQQWIKDAVKGGQDLPTMTDALLKAGYQPAISKALRQYLAEVGHMSPEEAAVLTAEDEAEADAARFRIFDYRENTFWVEDREVQVLLNLSRPNVTLFGNLLSHNECDALVEMSRQQLSPSRVVNSQNGAFDLQEARTSLGTYFKRAENPLIAMLEERICGLLKLPSDRGESIQVLHYGVGAQYEPHYDFFSPQYPGNKKVLAHGGQRVATMILYLNDVEAGGSTVFPKLGLDILPRKGCGLLFSYADDGDGLDYMTFHGGSPVLAGEKWIATKWFRQREFVSRHV